MLRDLFPGSTLFLPKRELQMASSFFFRKIDNLDQDYDIIKQIEDWSAREQTQTYLIDRPLSDERYEYAHKEHVIILVPGRKIAFVNFGSDSNDFDDFVDDFIEDLGSLSDKYRYKDAIGRPRKWAEQLTCRFYEGSELSLEEYLFSVSVDDPGKQRISELLVSLLTGSINDIERVKSEIPESLLEKVKRKILLFDGDQTRFIYQNLEKNVINIQGLSGTGKTELLLHKLKDIYLKSSESKIVFTCHNKILADSLRRRIPDFFNFMKVEQQIAWQERLWCMHAWGSFTDKHSGTYRYICDFYGISFQRYSPSTTFDKVCNEAIEKISSMENRKFAFDYILIDESQDFPASFIDLCRLCSRQKTYVAGDIFQSIFDEKIISSITPDFLLSKCYRTDPKTLMFAHGMGLFEPTKLRWLEDDEWKTCGYNLSKSASGDYYRLSRDPLRRFEDIENANVDCVTINQVSGDYEQEAATAVIEIIRELCRDDPKVTPDDIGVIIIDNANSTYAIADLLEQLVPRAMGWSVNKAHETKERCRGELFVSNRNNVKGLEFPFVICVTKMIRSNPAYRNSLYMTMTRSFLKSFLILSESQSEDVLRNISQGLEIINERGVIEVQPPTEAEKIRIRTTIEYSNSNMSFQEFVTKIFDEIGVMPLFRGKLMGIVCSLASDDFDSDNIRKIVNFNYDVLLKGETREDH
ncbi:DNA helicase [Agrobacterium tumefaciens]|uniref:DNA 3'-5' helicase II n=2 Tax=Rhizobium rhizogenes TaxID=359 RepID=A0AA92HAN3_RHIRH|nr:DNA helicase [Rhizobium rhizogenes]PVE68840.1 DNA helicase [Agrobacterium tumefaciens]PVE78588.1 DNA helicase [Sphingomonas sp. TPD3009]